MACGYAFCERVHVHVLVRVHEQVLRCLDSSFGAVISICHAVKLPHTGIFDAVDIRLWFLAHT